jgi:TRAP-type C4-dicarboxylate transport system permease small subunit
MILLNVATRYSGVPIYWDEAAVYLVVWLCFVGASTMTRLRLDFAVTLLTDAVGERHARRLKARPPPAFVLAAR